MPNDVNDESLCPWYRPTRLNSVSPCRIRNTRGLLFICSPGEDCGVRKGSHKLAVKPAKHCGAHRLTYARNEDNSRTHSVPAGNSRHWNVQWPAEEPEFAAGCANDGAVSTALNIGCPLIRTILRLRNENTSNRQDPCDEVGLWTQGGWANPAPAAFPGICSGKGTPKGPDSFRIPALRPEPCARSGGQFFGIVPN